MRKHLDHDWFPFPLPDNISIGKRSWLYSSFAFRHYQSRRPTGLKIGRDTGLYNGTFFDLGPEGEVEIGNFCTLVGAIICTNEKVVIGDYVFIAHEVVLADHYASVPAWDLSRPSSTFPQSPTGRSETGIVISENVWIGAEAIILSGAVIGTGAIIGAATVVDFQVPEYAVVAGNPGRIVAQR